MYALYIIFLQTTARTSLWSNCLSPHLSLSLVPPSGSPVCLPQRSTYTFYITPPPLLHPSPPADDARERDRSLPRIKTRSRPISATRRDACCPITHPRGRFGPVKWGHVRIATAWHRHLRRPASRPVSADGPDEPGRIAAPATSSPWGSSAPLITPLPPIRRTSSGGYVRRCRRPSLRRVSGQRSVGANLPAKRETGTLRYITLHGTTGSRSLPVRRDELLARRRHRVCRLIGILDSHATSGTLTTVRDAVAMSQGSPR